MLSNRHIGCLATTRREGMEKARVDAACAAMRLVAVVPVRIGLLDSLKLPETEAPRSGAGQQLPRRRDQAAETQPGLFTTENTEMHGRKAESEVAMNEFHCTQQTLCKLTLCCNSFLSVSFRVFRGSS